MTFTTQQALDILRDTPSNKAFTLVEFLEECRAVGAIQVRKEVLAETLVYHAARNNCGPLDMLVMMEDHNHAFVGHGTYWCVVDYLQPQLD